MDNAQLIGLSRQIALQRQMDVVANNIANLDTTGFKAEKVLFDEYLMPVARDMDFETPDQQLSFTQDWATIHDMSNGAVTETGNPLDVALNGKGFLAVDTPGGERYTRSGAMQISSDGTLVDLDGHPVLGELGPIHFDPSEVGISISPDGNVTTSAGSKGRLKLVEFADEQAPRREGDNLWSGSNPQTATATTVIPGAIEKSNVSGVGEITQMIRVQRAYDDVAAMLQRQDQMQQSAIRQLGATTA
jgi:flagellar basal-body rod protein FlgF